jgi:anti-anti-sigma factor
MKYEIEEVRDFLIVHIIGDMTTKGHLAILDDAITDHVNDGFHKFLFNLEKVEKLDVDGVGIFINCLTDVDEHPGGGCYILVEDDNVYGVIEHMGLDKMMKIFRNRDEVADELEITQFD